MPQISRRRANQLGDFMLHLELAAIDPKETLLVSVQRIGQRLYRPRFTGTGGTQQQEYSRRAPFRRQPRTIHLHVRNNLGDGVSLTNEAGRKLLREFLPPACGIGETKNVPTRTDWSGLAAHTSFSVCRMVVIRKAQC
jgi:hypothetical protein